MLHGTGRDSNQYLLLEWELATPNLPEKVKEVEQHLILVFVQDGGLSQLILEEHPLDVVVLHLDLLEMVLYEVYAQQYTYVLKARI